MNCPSITLKINTLGVGGPYVASIMIFHSVISALENVEGAPKFYSTDYCHQYVRYGGYGNVWGLVTCDPDGIDFFLKFIIF